MARLRRRNPRDRKGRFVGKSRRSSRVVHLRGRRKARVSLTVYRKNPSSQLWPAMSREAKRAPRMSAARSEHAKYLREKRATKRNKQNTVQFGPKPESHGSKVWVPASKGRRGYFRRKGKKRAAARRSARRSARRPVRAARRHYVARSRSTRRVQSVVKRIDKSLRKIRRRRGPKAAARRRALRTRKSALRIGSQRRAYGLSRKFRSRSRRYGMSRMNPSLAGFQAFVSANFVPTMIGVGFGVAAWALAVKGSTKLPDSVQKAIPESVKPFVPVITVSLASIAATMAASWLASTGKVGPSVPMATYAAGMGFVGLALMSAIKIKPKDAAEEVTLTKYLGLPVGEFVGVSGYVESNSGQMVAVNGLGEFVGVSGSLLLPSGESVTVNGVGNYVHQEVGLSGSIYDEFDQMGMLPNESSEQIPEGRDPSHGVEQSPTAEDIIELAEGGSLSGNIFGD